jgi:hypothetical protein
MSYVLPGTVFLIGAGFLAAHGEWWIAAEYAVVGVLLFLMKRR